MPLLETLAFTLGPAIAKYIVKDWLGDGVRVEIAKVLIDLVKGEGQNALTKYREGRVIEMLGQRIVKKMTPLFEQEARGLDKGSRDAIAHALALTLTQARMTAQQLVACRLDPDQLARAIRDAQPHATVGFSPNEVALYDRLIDAVSREMIQSANSFAGYERAYDTRVLQDLGSIVDGITRLLEEPDQKAQDYEAEYRRIVKDRLDRLETFGIPDVDAIARRQRLSVAYVSLEVSQFSRESEGDTEDAPDRERMDWPRLVRRG